MLHKRQIILFFGDVVALLLAFWLMLVFRFHSTNDSFLIKFQVHNFLFLFFFWLVIFYIFNLYDLRHANPNPRNIGLLVYALGINIGISIIWFYILPSKEITPKTNLLLVAFFSFIFIIIWHRIFYKLFTSFFIQKIGIIGFNPFLLSLYTELKLNPQIGKVVARWEKTSEIKTLPILNILIIETTSPQDLVLLSKKIDGEVLSLEKAYQSLFGKLPIGLMSDDKAINILMKKENIGIVLFYRIIEIILAVFVLIITSPLLLAATLAILLEDGRPIIYSQERIGKGGKIFTLYKLRSMKKNAEENGIQWALKNDIRITKVGKILRLLHIDEIPQMINIIKGDIAFVGPRPEQPKLVAKLEAEIPYYFIRHYIKPGFTGWAQIKFRYARTVLDSKQKFEYDLYYLNNKNPVLDIGIVLKTIQIIFTH